MRRDQSSQKGLKKKKKKGLDIFPSYNPKDENTLSAPAVRPLLTVAKTSLGTK